MTERPIEYASSSRKGVAFFGRIMANVSHEFNNVITVISELAGLLKDLSLMARKGREIRPDKIESISDNISRQVARGKHLITHMNRFSHSADDTRSKTDLVQVVENVQVLTDRLFKNRQTGFSFSAPSEECALISDPFEMRHLLFSCLDCFLDASSPEVSVTLHHSENGTELEIHLSGHVDGKLDDFSDRFDAVRERAAELNGRLLYECNESILQVRLTFPLNRE
jgi:C4-dicarboxylate-specific signal transduction histidine kinase